MRSNSDPVLEVPPQDLEAEAEVLGALMHYPEVRYEVLAALEGWGEDAFYSDRHKAIYRAIAGLIVRGQEPDLIPLKAALEDSGELEAVGGLTYLVRVQGYGSLSAPATARRLVELALLREQRDVARRLLADAQSWPVSEQPAADLAVEYAARLLTLSDRGRVRQHREAPEIVRERLQRREQRRIYFGHPDIDQSLMLLPGHVTVMAAATSAGKSARALHLAIRSATGLLDGRQGQRQRVVLWSGEMDRDPELIDRAVANLSGVHLSRVMTGFVTQAERQAMERAAEVIREAETDGWLTILDEPMRVRDLEARCLLVQQRHGPIDLLVVDYLGLLSDLAEEHEPERYDLRVGGALWQVRRLARRLGCHALVLHQFSRAVARRATARPQLTDLRDSSQVEQHAHNVLLLYRPDRDEGLSQAERRALAGMVEIIVAKARQGPVGSNWERFDGARMRFDPVPVDEIEQRRKGA